MSETIEKRNPLTLYEKHMQNEKLNNEQLEILEQDLMFLNQFDHFPIKSVNVRLTAFSPSDEIKETIIGRITGGSINIDGSSAIRRTCNLSLIVLDNDKLQTEYWAYNTEIKIEIGLNNYVNQNTYEDIIWFNMGRYVITSFNINKSATTTSVSISGKDKMCRLNGEISGNLPIQTDFGTIEIIQENGIIKIEKIELKEIIKQAIKQYGLEEERRIIIRDLDKIQGYELWEYKGSNPLYYFIKIEDKSVVNISLDNTIQIKTDPKGKPISLKNFDGQFYSYNALDPIYNATATRIGFPNDTKLSYYLAKIEYGETAGYHQTKLVYNGDLILNVGETITSLLDKIKAMLGEFEYFYDVDGNFIFQQKRTYTKKLFNSPFANEDEDDVQESGTPDNPIYSYKFENLKLITSIGKSPNVAKVKNDFSVWGTRKGVSGTEIPIHVRYAIHNKPTVYETLRDGKDTIYSTSDYDWRELIYQMAKDYSDGKQSEKTGYEQYYTDLLGFWRQIYNPNPSTEAEKGQFYDKEGIDGEGTMAYWNKNIHASPESLNFWMDFLDPIENTNFEQYSVNSIKSRTKSLNDSQVKSICYKKTPELLFILPGENLTNVSFTPLQVQDNMKQLFVRSAQGISAIDKTNEIINTNVAAIEGLSITAIPIYYLQPNTRIKVEGYGDYTLDKIAFNLSYNGTMSLTCNKIIEDLV